MRRILEHQLGGRHAGGAKLRARLVPRVRLVHERVADAEQPELLVLAHDRRRDGVRRPEHHAPARRFPSLHPAAPSAERALPAAGEPAQLVDARRLGGDTDGCSHRRTEENDDGSRGVVHMEFRLAERDYRQLPHHRATENTEGTETTGLTHDEMRSPCPLCPL